MNTRQASLPPDERRDLIVALMDREVTKLTTALVDNGYQVERQGGNLISDRRTYAASRNGEGPVYLHFESAYNPKSRGRVGIVCRVRLSLRDRANRYPAGTERGLNLNGIIGRCNEKLTQAAADKVRSNELALARNKSLNIVNDALAATGMSPLEGHVVAAASGYHSGQYKVELYFTVDETLEENLRKLVDAGLVKKAE